MSSVDSTALTTGNASGWSVFCSHGTAYAWSAFLPGASRSGTAADKATAEREARRALTELKGGPR